MNRDIYHKSYLINGFVLRMHQGLQSNWRQFWLLVLINAFVGSMVGLERSVIPGLAQTFGINGHTALLSFIIAFGTSKAIFNLITGKLMKHISRKRVLTIGWIIGLPVPFLLMYATSWNWILIANILLGINQGLTWSSTVIMKIDLVGDRQRGLAMGINEFAGYLSVGISAYLASEIASSWGYAFYPFLPGVFFAIAGLLLTSFFVKDTTHFVYKEAETTRLPFLNHIWKATTYQHRNLGSVTINGLINNLNDGVVWGLLPVLLLQKAYSIEQIGIIAGIYPAVWGVGQLVTGKMGDHFCKKKIIIGGMLLQAIGLAVIAFSGMLSIDIFAMILLGIGTALVYPNFLSVIAENTHPHQRSQSLSIYRFWRDSGYVTGALISGIFADQFGLTATFLFTAILTAAAGVLAELRMKCLILKRDVSHGMG